MITIVDLGIGNVGSVKNMFRAINIPSQISCERGVIEKAEKLILPGVGSFDKGMKCIEDLDLKDILNYKVLEEKIPVLGICLGMQLMCSSSEEGKMAGLDWLPLEVEKFDFTDKSFKVPHMGWNKVEPINSSSLFNELNLNKFYFVHSFYVRRDSDAHLGGTTQYGDVTFVSSIAHKNIYGTQFHPEKSHKYGKKLLSNFSKI